MEKTLGNTDANGAVKNVKDIVFFGNGDTFKLLCKASSEAEGWMKSTKAMEISGVGCLIQVTTQQKNLDGSYSIAEALSFVPNAKIEDLYELDGEGMQRKDAKIIGRHLTQDYSMFAAGSTLLKAKSSCCGKHKKDSKKKK